ncbi:pyridoxamine 5'-phosphate oxidase family protein [Actinomadura rudentiformis]|uniref:Pyridoxamine 5'-phosphate oxidase family protein n=1 Tax=Actinomadura rudentiformis TaxID=359158 RepID=A0A6H9Z7B9_9ACTN|nr:pyridoxamine 5'-phosphate oxidase family protein [Actinomadura rudentiformis]KAB2352246.1 pyridoxamine 5'-phosphate oxidase family protein [Actinomadura rudentiformis]
MPFDRSGLEILGDAECWALLESAPLGRIVFTDRALPAIQPVNFALCDGDVIIRTSPGSKLAAATRGAIVAFEADHFDTTTRTGWSVVAIGPARTVTDPHELTALQQLPLRPWGPSVHDHFIRIRPEILTGRRIPANTTTPVPR